MSTQIEARAGVLGAAALGIELADGAILSTVRDVHRAVVRRIHGGEPRISGAVYAGIGWGLRSAASGLRYADDRVGRPLEESGAGRFTVAALNGLFGDRIDDGHPGLAITMAPRRLGRDVVTDAEGLAVAYPDATGDVVVLLHGLGENDEAWALHREQRGSTYAEDLTADGWTPVVLRANTGLPIARNGVELAALLDRLVAGWPVPVRRIALVGHSMGGLVVRAACAVSTDAERRWADLVTDVVTLGTPHLGAPIAQGLTLGTRALALLPESTPFAAFLDHRSAGILDLRGGLPPDVLALPHARYRLVAATLSRSPRHPAAEVAGDLLVGWSSAVGRTWRGRAVFPDADVLHVPAAHHFDLLNHADVAAALREWLG